MRIFKDAIYLKLFRPDVLIAMEEAKKQRENPDQPRLSDALDPNQPKQAPQAGPFRKNQRSCKHQCNLKAPAENNTVSTDAMTLVNTSADVTSLLIDMMLMENNAWDMVIAESPDINTIGLVSSRKIASHRWAAPAYFVDVEPHRPTDTTRAPPYCRWIRHGSRRARAGIPGPTKETTSEPATLDTTAPGIGGPRLSGARTWPGHYR